MKHKEFTNGFSGCDGTIWYSQTKKYHLPHRTCEKCGQSWLMDENDYTMTNIKIDDIEMLYPVGHGGKRKGAGRKLAPKRYKKILILVTDKQLAWLDAQPTNRSETIRSFIQSKLSPAPRAGSRKSENETATDVERSD